MTKRIKTCVDSLKKHDLDALLLSNPLNITYLTGFRSADGYLLITTQEELFYFTNFIYEYEARQIKLWQVLTGKPNIFKTVSAKTTELKLKRIGFEAKNLTFLEKEKFYEYFKAEKINFLRTIDLVEKLRSVKDVKEISRIRKAVSIAMQAFDFASQIYSGRTSEKQLSIEIEKFLKLKDDNLSAFDIIVANQKNSAYPHHEPSGAYFLDGKFALIDLGAKYCGYCADLTRVFQWGKIPFFLRKIYDIVRKAQELSLKKISDGVAAKKVDAAARSFIEKKGYGKYFGHGLGHGVGLAVHESPFLNAVNEEILKEGMVVTIEPAIYLEGRFGIRLEDMVLVCKDRGELLSGNFYW
jgi:Xaa-Pro aminopeptidase